MGKIGFQNGVEAARLRMKRLDPGGFRADGTGAWDKFFRTIKHLVDEHDAAIVTPDPDPDPEPDPLVYAPRTYNIGSRNQDPRFCTAGLQQRTDGLFVDAQGVLYDTQGLNVDGRRDRNKIVAGLKPADEMDGREPCDPYNSFPPWPPGSYMV